MDFLPCLAQADGSTTVKVVEAKAHLENEHAIRLRLMLILVRAAILESLLAVTHAHLPLQFLQDTRVTLPLGTTESEAGGCFFYLAGVDDYESDPRYGSALDGREENVATVLLAHEPVQVR